MPKSTALFLLCLAVIAGMSPWFAAAAAMPDMVRETGLGPLRQALMSSAVQAGFVIGALGSAMTGISDRFDPRRVLAMAALMNAVATGGLLLLTPGSGAAIFLRVIAGIGFAGIYPVGMKIAVGWGLKDRGLLVGTLVGALTLGTAAPHLAAWAGGAEWRVVIGAAALASLIAALLPPFLRLGPHHAVARAFDPKVIGLIWSDRQIRAATLGYLGHMWELYAMWGWIGAVAAAGYAMQMSGAEAEGLASLTAFFAISAGALFCAPAGWLADRIGKAKVSAGAMAISGAMAILVALAHGGPAWLSFLFVLIWGAAVIPDSAQFSALIADAAPPEAAGSLMTLQTALGFTLTIFTVQVTPLVAEWITWQGALVVMALGPAFGIYALRPILRAPLA